MNIRIEVPMDGVDLLFPFLGLKVVLVYIDGREKPAVLRTNKEVGIFLDGPTAERFSDEEKSAVRKAAEEEKLPADFRAIVEIIRAFQLPEKLDMEKWEFRQDGLLPRGHLVHNRVPQAQMVISLEWIMTTLLLDFGPTGPGTKKYPVQVAIRLFQQIIAAEIPLEHRLRWPTALSRPACL